MKINSLICLLFALCVALGGSSCKIEDDDIIPPDTSHLEYGTVDPSNDGRYRMTEFFYMEDQLIARDSAFFTLSTVGDTTELYFDTYPDQFWDQGSYMVLRNDRQRAYFRMSQHHPEIMDYSESNGTIRIEGTPTIIGNGNEIVVILEGIKID